MRQRINENDQLDTAERDRLIDELNKLQREQDAKNDQRRRKQRALLEQRRLQRHKNNDNSGDGDLVEQFSLEVNQEIDQIELDFKQDIDVGTQELETKMAKLTEEHEEKIKSSDNQELTNQLMEA